MCVGPVGRFVKHMRCFLLRDILFLKFQVKSSVPHNLYLLTEQFNEYIVIINISHPLNIWSVKIDRKYRVLNWSVFYKMSMVTGS